MSAACRSSGSKTGACPSLQTEGERRKGKGERDGAVLAGGVGQMSDLKLSGRLCAAALLFLPLNAASAEIKTELGDDMQVARRAETGVHIALSPNAAQKAERAERLDLYRRNVAGEAAAKKAWQEL